MALPFFLTNVALHALILFSFLTAFFFLFARTIESNAYNSAIERLIDQKTPLVVQQLTPLSQQQLKGFINNLDQTQVDALLMEPDDLTVTNNEYVSTLAGMVLIFELAILLIAIIIFALMYKEPVSILHLLGENLIVFSLVGVVEYLFFTNVITKWVPAKPSLITQTLIDQTKTNIYNQTNPQHSPLGNSFKYPTIPITDYHGSIYSL